MRSDPAFEIHLTWEGTLAGGFRNCDAVHEIVIEVKPLARSLSVNASHHLGLCIPELGEQCWGGSIFRSGVCQAIALESARRSVCGGRELVLVISDGQARWRNHTPIAPLNSASPYTYTRPRKIHRWKWRERNGFEKESWRGARIVCSV